MGVNKTLFRAIRNHILEEPRRYNQGVAIEKVTKRTSPCGTQACLLGWAVILSGKKPEVRPCACGNPACTFNIETTYELGARVLRLTERQALRVYSDGEWPDKFQEPMNRAGNATERARAAADYINYIIRTGDVL